MTSLRLGLQRRFRLLFGALLNATALPLSRLAPRRSDHWVFGHQGDVFAGNAKYLFLWVSIHRPDLRVVWLSDREDTLRAIRQSGLPAFRRWSLQGVVAALRSKVFVYCHGVEDTNLHLSGGAYLLNLWHGVGLKATMLGDKGGIVSRAQKHDRNPVMRLFFLEYLTWPDAVVTTSPFMGAHFAHQFELPEARCPQLGYPRLDVHADDALRDVSEAIDRRQGFAFNPSGHAEVYIYMPTFRDTGRPFVEQALPDLNRLSNALRARNALLYVKLHRRTSGVALNGYENIERWPDEVDFYTYLDKFSIMITDYSSILYDYLFTKLSGVILYTFDYDQYVKDDRALLYSFDENTAGLRVSDFDRFCTVLEAGEALVEPAGAADVRRKFWGGCVAPVSPNVVAYVEAALAADGRAPGRN